MPAGLRGHDKGDARHRRGYAALGAAIGEGKPRGEAVLDRRTLGGWNMWD